MTDNVFQILLNRMCASYGLACDGCPLQDHKRSAGGKCQKYIEEHGMDAREIVKGWALEQGLLPDNGNQEKTPETRREILQAAERCVCGDRDQGYGGPEDSFALIASLWEPIIKARCVGPCADVCVDAVTVALCMAELKIARAATNETHMDSWVDLAGYAACGGEIASYDKE